MKAITGDDLGSSIERERSVNFEQGTPRHSRLSQIPILPPPLDPGDGLKRQAGCDLVLCSDFLPST
jgi:hypothetical protein